MAIMASSGFSQLRFHILGAGAIGCHIASLLHIRHPVTLLLRSKDAVKDFTETYKSTITYTRPDIGTNCIAGLDAESLVDYPADQPIEAVVVATKSQHAVESVRSIKPYLTRASTLVLLQNGMGLAEELLETLWPSMDDAPSFIVGVNRHSVERVKPFSIKHHSGWNDSEGGLMLGAMPHSNEASVNAVLKVFSGVPELHTVLYDWQELRRRMMRKLVVNASINPVAALLECQNGKLINNTNALSLAYNVCKEAAAILTELNVTPEELMRLIDHTLQISQQTNCSSVQDIKAKRKTEIDYINGYLVRLAKERNIPSPTNEYLINMVHAKELYIHAK